MLGALNPDGRISWEGGLDEVPMRALAGGGALRWSTSTGTKAADTALRLSSDGKEIYVKNQALSAENGELLERSLPTAADPVLSGHEQYFIGADQQRYMLAGHTG